MLFGTVWETLAWLHYAKYALNTEMDTDEAHPSQPIRL